MPIVFVFAAQSLAEFLELMKQGAVDWERPERCQCGEKDCFWAHGSYWRIVEEYELSEEIEVKRYKCRSGIEDFHKRCLWCGDYMRGKRTGARFCNSSHRVSFNNWKKETISEYKRAMKRAWFWPNPLTQSPKYPQLLDHPVIAKALHDRLEEVSVHLA